MPAKIEFAMGNDNSNQLADAVLQEEMASPASTPAPVPDEPVPWGALFPSCYDYDP